MLTRKLHTAYKITEKLVAFLEKREWENSNELLAILEHADEKIEAIVEKAISDVLETLRGSYSEEAQAWANNEITNTTGKPVKITKAEQRKARVEANKIKDTITKLYEIL